MNKPYLSRVSSGTSQQVPFNGPPVFTTSVVQEILVQKQSSLTNDFKLEILTKIIKESKPLEVIHIYFLK